MDISDNDNKVTVDVSFIELLKKENSSYVSKFKIGINNNDDILIENTSLLKIETDICTNDVSVNNS